MVQIIAGVKGEGKTKRMLDHAHNAVQTAKGNIVYLDKSVQNIHELDNKVRLINVSEYPIRCHPFHDFDGDFRLFPFMVALIFWNPSNAWLGVPSNRSGFFRMKFIRLSHS